MSKKKNGKAGKVKKPKQIQEDMFEVRKKVKAIRIDDDLWLKFKVSAIRERMTISEAVEHMIEKWLKERDFERKNIRNPSS